MKADRTSKALPDRLGIKEGYKIAILNPPEGYIERLGKVAEIISEVTAPDGSFDLIQCFTKQRRDLELNFPVLKTAIKLNGAIWISWPKGSSRVETDLNENVVREVGLGNGLVDVKVASVDEVWSALKFVFRLKNRT